MSRRYLWNDGRAWQWRAPPDELRPPTLEAVIAEWLSSHASGAAMTLLAARTLLGEALTEGAWREVSALDAGTFRTAQAELHRAGLLVEDDLTHPMLGDVALDECPAPVQSGLYTRAVLALQEHHPVRAAHWLDRSGLPDGPAAHLLERAARALQEAHDLAGAARCAVQAARRSQGQDRAGRCARALEALSDYAGEEVWQLVELGEREDPQRGVFALAGARLHAAAGRATDAERCLDGLGDATAVATERLKVRRATLDPAGVTALWEARPDLHGVPEALHLAVGAYADLGQLDTAQAHEFGLSPVQGARSGVPSRPSYPAAPAGAAPAERPPVTENPTPPASDAVEPVVLPSDVEVPRVPEVRPEIPQDAPNAAVTAALSALRRDLARETGYAAYLIFPNGTLAALAERQPRSMADFAGIAGLGPKRIEAYGDRILAAVEQAVHAPAEAVVAPTERPDLDVPAHGAVTAPPTAPASPEELISAAPLPQAAGTVTERPVASVQPLAASTPPAPRAQTAAELLEQVRAALEGDGGILALLEDLAALPELAGGLNPEQARTVLEPLDDARGLLGTLVMLHKRARRQQDAVRGTDPVRKTPEA